MASNPNKSVSVTIASENGAALPATKTVLLNPARIISAETSGSGVLIKYDDGGDPQHYITSTLTLAQLNTAINDLPVPGAREYIFKLDASSGKAIGTHDLVDLAGNPATIPANSRVFWGTYETTTTFTSATDAGTIGFSIATDDVLGIKAAVAISVGTTYDAAAPKVLIQDNAIANISEKTTAERAIQAVVAVEALTAGVMYIWLKVITSA